MDILSLAKAKQYADKLKTEVDTQRQQDILKVTAIDKELNDFQKTLSMVNVNQEAKQSVTGYGTVSLPKNAANGQVSAVVKGETRTNIAKINSYEGIATTENVELVAGKTYTLSAFLDLSATTDLARMRIQNTVPTYYVGNTISAGIKGYSTVTFTPTISGLYSIYIQKLSTNDTNKPKVSEILLEETDTRKTFITGTKSTISASRLKSVGKNLLNISKIVPGRLDAGVLGYQSDSTVLLEKNKITVTTKVKFRGCVTLLINIPIGATNIRLSGTTQSSNILANVYFYSNGVFVSETSGVISRNISIPSGITSFRVWYLSNDIQTFAIDNPQIEFGSIATPYESYQESAQYVIVTENGQIAEARSLLNGTKDEIRVSEGKSIIRTGNKNFKGTELWAYHAYDSTYGIYIFKILNWKIENNSDVFNGDVGNSNKATCINADGNFAVTTSYNTSTWGNSDFAIGILNNELRLMVKGSKLITTVLELQNYLALKPVTLTYQLAVPLEIPIEVSGTLLSYPSGTVYFEKAVADAGIYSGGISVLHQDLPIKEIEKISKIDFMTGLETVLDVSQAVIASDRLSFTHPGLTKDDITFFTYFYDKEGTEPELTVEYYDSRYVLKDSVTGKYYKVVQTVANGVLSQTLVEV